MLRKVHCRRHLQSYDTNLVSLPLLRTSSGQPTAAAFLNESHNCAEIFPCQHQSSSTHYIRKPSLIAIDIDDDDEFVAKQSLIRLAHNNRTPKTSSYRFGSRLTHTQSSPSVNKQTSDSPVFVHRLRPVTNRHSRQRTLSSHSPNNANSTTDDSSSSATDMSPSSSISDVSTPLNQTKDKTWRLQIHDDLNKDGSRHNVMHKGSEESVRRRRQSKREKRPEEKKQRIKEKILQANQRWQKYSNIDDELVFFISRYSDQLPLCSDCRSYFNTEQTQFLSEDPRASLDYAADAVLNSPNNKTMTQKQAAKSRLIQDYNKQSDLLFNLCDTCLRKSAQIRNELKEINFARKMSHLSDVSPIQDQLLSPTISSPTNVNVVHQQEMISTPPDLNQIYMNNVIQNHQIRLQQLYEQSQTIINTQQHLPNDQSQLQSCIKQMQYHCLELLHLQYPGCLLSFPYMPSSDLEHLSYRHQQSDASSGDSEHSSSSMDENECSPVHCDNDQPSMDDRLTIETCHGLVEYCNAPLDDFIRGVQVLQCLSNFNHYPI